MVGELVHLPPPDTDTTWFRVLLAVSLARVAAGDSPVEGTIPPIAGGVAPVLDGALLADVDAPGDPDDPVDGDTDLAVSVVLFEPTVDWLL